MLAAMLSPEETKKLVGLVDGKDVAEAYASIVKDRMRYQTPDKTNDKEGDEKSANKEVSSEDERSNVVEKGIEYVQVGDDTLSF